MWEGRTYEVRAAGDGVARDDGRADAGDELFAGNDLLAQEVTTALRLHLVLDVARRNARARVLRYRAADHRRAAESIPPRNQGQQEPQVWRVMRVHSPSVRVGDDRARGVQAADHLRALFDGADGGKLHA